MITHDQLLPSLFHMQRQGRIGASRFALNEFARFRLWLARPQSPKHSPAKHSPLSDGSDLDHPHPDLFSHFDRPSTPREHCGPPPFLTIFLSMSSLEALRHDQHVCAVKSLC